MNKKKECNKLGTAFMWLIQELCLFVFGGLFYYFIEILWRGHSHYSMMILGGLCYVIIGLINEVFPYDLEFEVQVIIGDIIVTILEFIAGLILNVWLGLGIWDYSNVPFNIMGQICIPYMFLWLFLVAFAIILDDWTKYAISNCIAKKLGIKYEYPHPHYNFYFKNIV